MLNENSQHLNKRGSVYFPGLNGIRFFAAVGVIIHHTEQYKFTMGRPDSLWRTTVVGNLGHLGVSLFFVLSGFLITYLLLTEREKNGDIRVKEFYLRRVLRIWPLYYLIIFSSFFIFPFLFRIPLFAPVFSNFPGKLFLYTFFLPNAAHLWYGPVMGAAQAWSVGVEEQFYFVWPWLVKKIKFNLIPVFCLVIFFKFIFENREDSIMAGAMHLIPQYARQVKFVWSLIEKFEIERLTMGALGAYLVYYNYDRVLRVVFHWSVQLLSFAALFVFLINSFGSPYYLLIEPAVFIVLILNVSCNPKSFLKLENEFYNYLGKISYGLYMYHPILVFILLSILARGTIFLRSAWLFNSVGYLLVFTVSILVSSLSYKYYEGYFLKLKSRHAVVLSGG